MRLMKLSKEKIDEQLRRGRITVSVVGLGRVGLPTACILAEAGARVLGVDINGEVVRNINLGKCHLVDEPGLDELLRRVVKEGKLKASEDYSDFISKSDAIIVSVPTPINESRVPHCEAILDSFTRIGESIRRSTLVVVESTISPGMVENTIVPLLEKCSGMKVVKDFGIASCPERVNPGESLANMKSLPRVVGGIDRKSTEIAAALYRSAFGVKVIEVPNPKTANAVKLTENIFRDVNIALMNEFAILYERLGIDVITVINTCATKWNFVPHYPGAGVGGPCLPANAYYIIDEGQKVGYIPYLIRMAREINDRMPDHVVTLVGEALNSIRKVVSRSKIAILGVSYKPNVHDLQITPMKHVFETLEKMGAYLTIYDPMFKEEKVFGLTVDSTLERAVADADCIVIGTAHKEFKTIDLKKIHQICRKPAALVDTANVVDPEEAKKAGFSYIGVGRRSV